MGLMRAALLVVALLSAAPAAAQRYDQGLLWRVESPTATAHVFGTIHVEDKRVTTLPPPVAKAFDASRSLVVEMTMEPANVMALATRMLLQDGRDLPGIAGPELFGKAAALIAPYGLPEPALRMFKPWAAAVFLMIPQQNPENVLDMVLARTAAAKGKPVHELETVNEQVDVFDGMTEADQVALLRHAVDSHQDMPKNTARLVEAWLARDLAQFTRISEDEIGDSPELRRLDKAFRRRLLDDRNARMAERLDARLKEGGAFVAIGALHLPGKDGVLARLERRGWRITRVY